MNFWVFTSSNACHQWTTDCTGTDFTNGRCRSCREPVVHMSTVDPSTREILDELEGLRPRRETPWTRHGVLYTPRTAVPAAPWRTRWRLTQQRPRDGLRTGRKPVVKPVNPV